MGSSNTSFFYYPAVRTGSSNTHVFCSITPLSGWGLVTPIFLVFFFGGGSLAPDLRFFARPKQILVVSSATQVRARILFCTLGVGQTTAGSNAPGAFYPAVRTGSSNTRFFKLFFHFFGGHLPQTSGFLLGQTYSSAGNNSRSSDIVRPNFEIVRPILPYGRTWCPNTKNVCSIEDFI